MSFKAGVFKEMEAEWPDTPTSKPRGGKITATTYVSQRSSVLRESWMSVSAKPQAEHSKKTLRR